MARKRRNENDETTWAICPIESIAYIFTVFLLAFLLLAPLEALHTAEQVAAVNAGKPRD